MQMSSRPDDVTGNFMDLSFVGKVGAGAQMVGSKKVGGASFCGRRCFSGHNADRWLLRFGALLRRPHLPAQIERAVDEADMTIGLWKIPEHAASPRVKLFREQAYLVAAREQRSNSFRASS